jgi:prepilin-type N-terminal cleavage/methylation domain-containing protein/prepilin-type processing-associated H-X9-DG protein
MRTRKAFTLIELLVVISIIAMLIALLLPGLQRVRNQGRAVVCQANLKQWGATLNMYIEDNEGCFPCYEYEPDIIWFLRGSLASYNNPVDKSIRPVNTKKISCCPMAVRRGSRIQFRRIHNGETIMEGWRGTTFEAYELMGPGRPFRLSYGFNGWLFNEWFSYGDIHPPGFHRHREESPNIFMLKGSSNIPVFLDCTMPYSRPKELFPPPPRRGGGTGPGMQSFCMNRHNGYVNGLFLDWSVRKVGVKELWTLKWHLQFDTANAWTKAGGVLPEDWPYWMRKFKDY